MLREAYLTGIDLPVTIIGRDGEWLVCVDEEGTHRLVRESGIEEKRHC